MAELGESDLETLRSILEGFRSVLLTGTVTSAMLVAEPFVAIVRFTRTE